MRFHCVVLKSLLSDADFMQSNKYDRLSIVCIIKSLGVITKTLKMSENEATMFL